MLVVNSKTPYIIIVNVPHNVREEDLLIKPIDDLVDSDYVLDSDVSDGALEGNLTVRQYSSIGSYETIHALGSLVADNGMESDMRITPLTRAGGYPPV